MEKFRFYLEDVDDSTIYRLQHDCGGWSEYGVNYGRETQISNVVKSYTDGWDFYKEDCEWIKDRFYKYGPNRRIRLVVESLSDAMKGKYEIAYRGYLDLTQIEIGMTSVNVPTMESGFFKSLENKWSEEYEYNYDTYCKINGNVFSEKAEFVSTEMLHCINTLPNTLAGIRGDDFLLGGEISNSNDVSDKVFQATSLQYLKQASTVRQDETNSTKIGNTMCFMIVDGNKINSLDFQWDIVFKLDCSELRDYTSNVDYLKSSASLNVAVIPLYDDMSLQPFWLKSNFDIYKLQEISFQGIYVDDSNYTFVMNFNGEKTLKDIGKSNMKYGLIYYVQVVYGEEVKNGNPTGHHVLCKPGTVYSGRFIRFDLSAKYEMILNEKTVSAMKAESLFKRLINSINDNRYNVVCDLSDFNKVASSDLITSNSGLRWKVQSLGSGKSRRSYALTGKVKTSLQQFLEYCYAVYNYQIAVDYDLKSDTYRVYLAHFDNMYDGKKRIASLGGINNVSMQVWRDVLYSKIEVGYETSDEAINIDREFNCKFTFTTPNTEIEENVLQLLSPYDASTRDIETELYLNYRNEDDDSNDKVFIIAAKYQRVFDDGHDMYEINRDISVLDGSPFPDYEWNVKFSPKRMLLAHARELFSYFAFNKGGLIEFSLCDHNSLLVAGGLYENEHVEIGGDIIFRPLIVSVTSKGDVDYIRAIDGNRLGYISFVYGNRNVKGFLAKDSGAVSIKPIKEQTCEYRLILSADSEFRI